MKIAAHVNRLLSPFGLHLRRLPRVADVPEKPGTRGHHVELIGPTGVGKTYLHDRLLPEIETEWLSWRQVRPLLKEMEEDKPFIDLDGASSALVDDLLAQKKRAIWALDLPVWRKVELLHYVIREMALDIRARARVVPVAGLLSDEGVTHNFATELLRWHEERGRHDPSCEEALNHFLRGRSIILLDADDDTILKNLRHRHDEIQGRKQNDLIAYWEEARVLRKTRHDRRTARRWLELATSLGIPTLTVDLREGLDLAKQKVRRFLEDIQLPAQTPDARPQPVPVLRQRVHAR
jgi:hypothetical protein